VLSFTICVFAVAFVLVFSPASSDDGTFSKVVSQANAVLAPCADNCDPVTSCSLSCPVCVRSAMQPCKNNAQPYRSLPCFPSPRPAFAVSDLSPLLVWMRRQEDGGYCLFEALSLVYWSLAAIFWCVRHIQPGL
jgi:hypothetical protein